MANSVHEFAAKGFDVSSDAYERGRPEYPADAVDFLISKFDLGPTSRVADLGAGTGKFTKMLRDKMLPQGGVTIIAVEPVEGMRKKFLTVLPDVEILNGTAEAIPLENESLDAVVIAQAFHWFNGEATLKEIYRVLKPNGKIGLIWNARDESVPWVSQLTEIIDPHERGAPRYKSGEWRKAFDHTTLFSKLAYAKFGYVQRGNVETIVDRVGSISFIASLALTEKETVLEQVRKCVRENAQDVNGAVELPYRTDVFVCSKL